MIKVYGLKDGYEISALNHSGLDYDCNQDAEHISYLYEGFQNAYNRENDEEYKIPDQGYTYFKNSIEIYFPSENKIKNNPDYFPDFTNADKTNEINTSNKST